MTSINEEETSMLVEKLVQNPEQFKDLLLKNPEILAELISKLAVQTHDAKIDFNNDMDFFEPAHFNELSYVAERNMHHLDSPYINEQFQENIHDHSSLCINEAHHMLDLSIQRPDMTLALQNSPAYNERPVISTQDPSGFYYTPCAESIVCDAHHHVTGDYMRNNCCIHTMN